VVAVDNASGDYLVEQRGLLEFADSNFYDGAILVYLAMVRAAAELDDPSQMTREQVRDNMMFLADKSGTVVFAGPDELAGGIEAIQAGDAIDYDGASGPVDFSEPTTNPEENDDAGGDVEQNLEEFHLIDGGFVPGDLFDCIEMDCARVTR
jgi:hypothetical protein